MPTQLARPPSETPSTLPPETAAYLRNVMRHASSLIYVVGHDPGASRWTPWELGFFDGRQSARRIGIDLADGFSSWFELKPPDLTTLWHAPPWLNTDGKRVVTA